MNDKNDEDKDEDIWCCCCGDRTYYGILEDRVIEWHLKDTKKGIGICASCADAIAMHDLKRVMKDEFDL